MERPVSKNRRFSTSAIYGKRNLKELRPSRNRTRTNFSSPSDSEDLPEDRRISIHEVVKVKEEAEPPRLRVESQNLPIRIKEEPISPTSSPQDIPKVYKSLPSSPIRSSTPTFTDETREEDKYTPPFSLWEYLREELLATDFDSHQELKWERVGNFLSVPVAVEKIISFGFILCFDSFLHTFTILPIRFVLAIFRLTLNTFSWSRPSLPPSQKADILRMLLLVISMAILIPLTDASKIYHSIRGQDTIKLYVIFNALEIADRLFTSIGQDIIDCLFSRSSLLLLSHHVSPTSHTIRPFFYFFLGLLYTVSHSLILVYELMSLNVAINAYDHSLLTLLLSNQFVEIKGSVFKKFEKDNLFQITCADIVERFQLTLMLFCIALRNLIELSTTEVDLDRVVLPRAFQFVKSGNLVWKIFSPVLTVLLSEMGVDWLKHAFITKFNHIRGSVYERYTDVLCRDLSTSQGSWVGKRDRVRKHTYVDQSPLVSRRLGFASLPMAVLALLILYQSASLLISTHMTSTPPSLMLIATTNQLPYIMKHAKWIVLGILAWLCLVVVKLIIGVNLLSYASRRTAFMDEREREDDRLHFYGRPPIGEGKDEQDYNRHLKDLLNQARDNVPPTAEMGENQPQPKGIKTEGGEKAAGGGNKKAARLEDLTRFTMTKRIW
ncbi:hypothetical protein BOTBODRAFT_26332 [Botryobasidium botryosum FD-172 SS1]|uniref:DUF747-domain-containing protein n=1 Tax=Botryobasidium botryosum (strain FD-172 SS1) TaxID=930990 RepID=A0A067N257_BOTB1|nr:hypothetical protein BOTBODRAFT_26332 [Botryobasidium botryosum FD-172 SS1]